MDDVLEGNGRLTLGTLRQFAEQYGLGDDTVVYVEREHTDENGRYQILEDRAVGAKVTMYTGGGGGYLVICIDAIEV